MAPTPDSGTVKAQLAKTRATLAAAGISYAWLDAEVLLAHVMRGSRVRLHTHPEERLTAAQERRLARLSARRAERTPVHYLIGEREFYGYLLRVTPAVLIPRPESELLVDLAIEWLNNHRSARRMIDLGTGSGAVAIAVAKAVPLVRIIARDVSVRALRVAAGNISRHRVRSRVSTVKGDLLRGAKPADLIVANLPYISERQKRVRPRELEYEPALALDGGIDGLSLIRAAIAQAPEVLRPGGALLFECDPSQAQRLQRLARDQWPAGKVTVHKDLAGRDRVVRVQS
jgi:release factor glutamine methyltransferase